MKNRVLVLNGPNLNLLGQREPSIYGSDSVADIEAACHDTARSLGLEVQFHQSNHEGQLIDWVQAARADCGAIIINPAGYTTTSVALLDALRTFDGPIIEVHISNIYRREAFRHHSYVAMAATGTICGLGSLGYTLALQAVADRLGTLRQL